MEFKKTRSARAIYGLDNVATEEDGTLIGVYDFRLPSGSSMYDVAVAYPKENR